MREYLAQRGEGGISRQTPKIVLQRYQQQTLYLLMLKHLTILYLFIALATQSNAQDNLVPNGSFEELDTCPYTFSQIRFAKHWFSPSLGTPDLYNVCDFDSSLMSYNPTYNPNPAFTDSDIGFDQPHEGVSFAGITINTPLNNDSLSGREYVAIRLNQKLEKNKYYCFSMYCSYPTEAYRMFYQQAVDGLPPSAILYTTSSVGVCFSEDSIFQNHG